MGFEPTSRLRDYLISSQGRYDLFDTCPYIKFLYVKPSNLAKLKIKAKFRAKQGSFYEMQNLKTQVKSRTSVSRSSLRCITFRVRAVMTSSIPVQILKTVQREHYLAIIQQNTSIVKCFKANISKFFINSYKYPIKIAKILPCLLL